MDGMFAAILKEGQRIPRKGSMDFSTSEDYQDFMIVHILQGQSFLVKKNTKLASYRISRLPKVLKGIPQLRVTIEVDKKGRLKFDADELFQGVKPVIEELPDH